MHNFLEIKSLLEITVIRQDFSKSYLLAGFSVRFVFAHILTLQRNTINESANGQSARTLPVRPSDFPFICSFTPINVNALDIFLNNQE